MFLRPNPRPMPPSVASCIRRCLPWKAGLALACLVSMPVAPAAMTWHWNAAPSAYEAEITDSMNNCIATWNAYSNYNHDIGVIYASGTPTADAGYLGQIRFGGSRNYRTAMHESSHWMGTGTMDEWGIHQRWAIWNGTYGFNLRCAYDGPGERQFIYGAHYGPQGANYDSEGVQGPQMVGIIGAKRRDMNLWQGDQTIGIATGTYRLRNRVSVKTLDSMGVTTEGAQPKQGETVSGNNGQLWNVTLISGTIYFTLQNVATGKYLDSQATATDGAPLALTTLSGAATDSQLWQIVQTDSFFFKIVNKANGKGLDHLGATEQGSGVSQWNATNNFSWNQQWTFLHALAQTAPEAGVVSHGRPVTSSTTEGGNYDWKGNNGVSGDRWTASSGTFPQWWRVDTGTLQPITKVEVDWYPEGGRTYQYQIEVSNDDANWTVAADRTANTVTGTTVDHLTTSARFVRVKITGSSAGFAAIMECRVYNEAQPMKNLSVFRPCNASSEQSGNLAVNANNVDPVLTRWCASSSGFPAWWQVDLGSAQQVNKAVISWFDDDARSYQYRIEGSTDGVNYFTLADRTSNTTAYTTSDSFSGVARWVRIYVTGGSGGWASIYDAQIYGATGPQVPSTPVSLTATATASEISLSWPAVGGASLYTVKRANNSGGPYAPISTQAGTSFTDSTVVPGIVYYYVVSAANATGSGSNSTEAAAAAGAELQVGLPFDETGGAVAPDVSGFERKGTLINGAAWAAGTIGNAVDLDGTDDYVALPAGVVSGLNDFTVAAWVNPEANATWARLFDFGTGTNNYMFLAPSNGGAVRFAIRTPSVNEQQLTGPAVLPAGTWSHVAVTLSGNMATLYVNGTSVATNKAMTLRPSSLGVTTQNWIGRAQFADPYLNGRVDDFRIYNRALNSAELGKLRGITAPVAPTALAAQAGNGQITLRWVPSLGATSYVVKRSNTSGGPYAIIAAINAASHTDMGLSNGSVYHYVVSALNAAGGSADSGEISATPAAGGAVPPAAPAILNPYEVGGKVKLAWSPSSAATSYKVKRSTTSGGPYEVIGTTGSTSFTDATVTLGTGYHYVVSAVGVGGEGADSYQASVLPSTAIAAAYLKMDEASGDLAEDETSSNLDGTLVNGPTRTTGRLDRAISLDGSNDHVTLPVGAVSGLDDFTFSTWVRASALATWSRLLDFGTGTDNYMFLTLKSPTGKPRFAIRTPGVNEQAIESSVVFPLNTWVHVAVTISGDTGTLYLNGAVVGSNGNMSLKPSSLGSTTQNYLGRSQFPDPYFGGLVDEFQIRNRALTLAEVADVAAPPSAPTGVVATAGSSQINLSWNGVASATGYTVKRGTVSGGSYATLATNVQSAGYVDSEVSTGTTYYYVVLAQKQLAESAKSAQANATVTAPSASEAWRGANFGSTGDTGNAAMIADPDADAVQNLWEYFHGTNPNASNGPSVQGLRSDNRLAITFSRSTTATDLTVNVQAADSLAGPWIDLARSVNGAAFTVLAPGASVSETGSGESRSVEVRDVFEITDAEHPKRFLRLEAQVGL